MMIKDNLANGAKPAARRSVPWALCLTGLMAGLLVEDSGLAQRSRIDAPSSKKIPSHSKKGRLNVVKSVNAETDESSSIISVFLERTPSWQRPKVSFQKNFVQVELKGITVLEPGKSYPTKSPHFKKIIPYQIKPGLSALRIYLAKPAKFYEKALSCDILGERLLIYLDHSFIDAPAANAVREERLSQEVDKVIATTKVNRSIPDPAALSGKAVSKTIGKNSAKASAKALAAKTEQKEVKAALDYDIPSATEQAVAVKNAPKAAAQSTKAKDLKKEAKSTAGATKQSVAESPVTDPLPWEKGSSSSAEASATKPSAEAEGFYSKLQDKMKTVAVITVFLLMLLGAVHYYRRKKGQHGGLAVQTPHGKLAVPSLKPLASYSIGPKQKLTLIGLNNKMILLGVSADSIQYLYATEDANDPELSDKIAEGLGGGSTLHGRQAMTTAPKRSSLLNQSPRAMANRPQQNRPAAPEKSTAQTAGSSTAIQSANSASPRANASTGNQRAASRAYARAGGAGRTHAATTAGATTGTAPAPRAAASSASRQTAPQQAAQQQQRSGASAGYSAEQLRQGASHADPAIGNEPVEAPRQAIEDVTSLIRKKLKDLPSI